MIQFQRDLESCGLTSQEAKIYLVLLQENNLKAGQIAKITGVKRATTYVVLDTLIEKGLISVSSKEGILIFHAEPPLKIKEYLKKNRQEIDAKLKLIGKIEIELESMRSNEFQIPKISIFAGPKGIDTLLTQILNNKGSSTFIFGEYTKDGDPIPAYTSKRIHKKIKAELITPQNIQAKVQIQKDRQSFRTTFMIPQCYSLPASIHISGNDVTLFTHSNEHPIGVLIRDKDIAQTLASIHKLISEKI